MLNNRVSETRGFKRARFVLGQCAGDGVFALSVAGGEDLWGCTLTTQEVDDVQKSLKIAVLVLVANGDEGSRHARRNTDRVLYVKVLMNRDNLCNSMWRECHNSYSRLRDQLGRESVGWCRRRLFEG